MSSSPLRRLKRAVERVKLSLVNNIARWIYDGGVARRLRRLSWEEPHGLLDVISVSEDERFYDANSSYCSSQASSPASEVLERTMSSVWREISRNRSHGRDDLRTMDSSSSLGSDDVDDRSANFIAGFRRHLENERQISIELRYPKSKSFEQMLPPAGIVEET